MKPQTTLHGRVAVVTGAGNGIGRAIAESLAEAGADVVLGDIDTAAAVTAAEEIGKRHGSRVVGLHLDVTDDASVRTFVDAAEEQLGPIGLYVNNAGIMWVGPYADEPEAVALRQFDVNFHGVIRGIKAVAPRMRERRRGHVITVASAASRVAPPGEATYTATKHAVYGYHTAVREELNGSGVVLSLVMPGVVDTELAAGTTSGAARKLTPQQVAEAVVATALKPRFEVFLPKSVGGLFRASVLLPQRVRDLLFRFTVPNQLRPASDLGARAAYENRIADQGKSAPKEQS